MDDIILLPGTKGSIRLQPTASTGGNISDNRITHGEDSQKDIVVWGASPQVAAAGQSNDADQSAS